MYVAGLKFLYGVTLERPEIAARLVYPKVPYTLPDVLSGSQVQTLLEAVTPLCHRAVVVCTYASGLRISEACRLQVGDINRQRDVIHVRGGKGKRDRFVPLGPALLGFEHLARAGAKGAVVQKGDVGVEQEEVAHAASLRG